MKNNFDSVSLVYEIIKKIVFGSKLYKAECYWFHQINKGSKLLVLGGGNGNLINHLPDECTIDYIDLSSKMIGNARKKPYMGNIEFINADYLTYENHEKYDWVIANFFLDVFISEHLERVVQKVSVQLKEDGRFLVTDFQSEKSVYGNFLLKCMHAFFNLVATLESKHLKSIVTYIQNNDFQIINEQYFFKGRIFSIIFQKDGNLST